MTLQEWLRQLETRHPQAIELGLARVGRVARALWPSALPFRLLTVGGTNGKGSVCADLEAILLAAGYRVGLYTSPHLLHYNERVRLQGREVSDGALVEAFEAVESVRGETSLTYFEFGTLAAMWLFLQAQPDVVILEVGLGGRLDAVNVWDADCAVITSIDLDHTEYLGSTREAIGKEKAGIFRRGRPAVCGDPFPPDSLRRQAALTGADWYGIQEDFFVRPVGTGWAYSGARWQLVLPRPAMPGAFQTGNAACAIAALECLAPQLPVDGPAIASGLLRAALPGRFQRLPAAPQQAERILDVAHNPHGAAALAANLAERPPRGRTLAVFSMLADKDGAAVLELLRPQIDLWLTAPLDCERAASAERLREWFDEACIVPVQACATVAAAWAAACEQAGEDDRIVAFGSFHTVAQILAAENLDARAGLSGSA